ncbi:MAG TPA: phospholipid carrier-dependent glycosyltransferase, partial [Anaerolineae bacterium]
MEFLSAGVASERRALAVVLIPFFLLALFYAVSVPILEGPDEDDHFRYAKFIADHRALPVQLFQAGGGQAGHQGWQPPLYYALVALAISPIDTRDFGDHLWRNPNASYQGDPACCGRNLYYHSSGEDFPYTGTTLAVHLGRLISILFGLVTLASLFLLAQKVLASIALSLAVTAVAAFNPSFLFASALVSNDIPLAAFCTLTFLVLARILSRAGESNLRNVILVALFVAGGILSKTTALGLVPFVLGVLAFADWRAGRLHKFGPSQIALKFLVHALIFGTILVVLTGWYFARNQSLYGDPAALALINASAIFPRATPPTLFELFYINLPWLWQTFWGGPVPGDFSPVLLGGLTLLACLALLGLGVRTVRNLKRLGAPFFFEPPFPILIVLVGWLGFIVVSQIQFIRISGGTDQGRYLFPAMASFAILFVVGLRQFHLFRTPLLYLLPLFLFSLALAVP